MVLVHQQAVKGIQYENTVLPGEIRAKGRYMDYLANEDQPMVLTPLREKVKQ